MEMPLNAGENEIVQGDGEGERGMDIWRWINEGR